ncbi:helix-turn-helix domain-containing protein [Streptomyces sp. NPDC006622]|uniref:helix-turn-helix transcriptional regulator n=1 Tax=Streptomyces sp. NPDC006622 TaxID=3155459 RepID=UPI0033A7F57E
MAGAALPVLLPPGRCRHRLESLGQGHSPSEAQAVKRPAPADPRSAGTYRTPSSVSPSVISTTLFRGERPRAQAPPRYEAPSRTPHGEPLIPAQTLRIPSTAPSSSVAVRTAFLTVKDAADYLGLSPHTLYVWRHRRQGPPSFRMGPRGRVKYRVEALDAWVREQEQADSRSNPALSPLSVRPQERSARSVSA